MDKKGNTPSRIKLELFFYNDKGEEVPEIFLELKPAAGGGDDSVRYKISMTNEEVVKATVDNAAGYLAGTIRKMPPGTLKTAMDNPSEEFVAIREPAGEGVEYVKHELVHGRHMVLLDAKIKRSPGGLAENIKGRVHLFEKLKPETPSENPQYKILKNGEWKEIKDIDEYVEKHKLVVYKLNIDRQ